MSTLPARSGLVVGLCVLSAILLGSATVAAAGQPRSGVMATVTTNAPIYIGPKVTPVPLRTAAIGTRLEVLMEEGEWVQVRFGDPVFGPRVGWVQATLIRIERPETQPMDLSVPTPAESPSERRADPRASAQPAGGAPGSDTFERSGFLIGVSAGPGFLGCEDCDWEPGLALDFHLGGMVGDRVGLMYDNAAMVVSADDTIYTLDTMTFAVQYFPGRRGWIKAGAGFALFTCADCFSFPVGDAGLGVMVGAGGEIVQRGRFAMDVQGRFTLNFFEGGRLYTTLATLGFNWY